MPFVRFSRDRRGYEHVYLVDSKEHGRSRVLYWFRTPPGVRVGRSPFDPATQRSLEQQYPEVKFDWSQIVAARIPPPAPVENWREKRRAERAFKRARAEEAPEAAEPEPLSAEALPLDTEIPELEENGVGHEPIHETPAETLQTTQSVLESESPSNAVSGTRRRRRRRRRGRRPDAPTDVGTPASNPDDPLDQADSPEKTSNEE